MILFIYRILINTVLLFSPIIILVRLLKRKEDVKRFREKLGFFSKNKIGKKLIWFHGASVGELLSIIPLVENLEKDKNINQILITSSTISSAKVFNKFKFKKSIHQFFPIDANIISKKFLNYWKPCMAIFIDSEIWPNTIHNLNKRKVPTILLNARITRKSFKRWCYLGNFGKKIFHSFTYAFPCNKETLNYLKFLGVINIKLIGNLKFSQTLSPDLINLSKSFLKSIKKRLVFCASSTHPGEEKIIMKAHLSLKEKYKNLLTIIIPRHIERLENILIDLDKLKMNYVIRTSNKKIDNDTEIYLVDTYGETEKFLEICKIVFMGKSLTADGGQNPLEAVRENCLILHGPKVSNFREIYKYLNEQKISFKIKNHSQFFKMMLFLFKNNDNSLKVIDKINLIGPKILKNNMKEINSFIK